MDLSEVNIPAIAVRFGLLLLALTVHETAHGWSASRFGDQTARMLGRVSLNPLVHIDPIGTVIFPLMAMVFGVPLIGWAKPTPVNPLNLKDPKRMGLWISAAGPLSNLALASMFLLLLAVLARSGFVAPGDLWHAESEVVTAPVMSFLKMGLIINVVIAYFNLIPIPPLDGGGVLAGLLPDSMSGLVHTIGQYGFILLYVLVLVPIGNHSLLSWLLLPVLSGLDLAFALAVGR